MHWHPWEPFGDGFWAVTRHADVVRVSKDHETFSSARGHVALWDLPPDALEARRSLIETDPPEHHRLRRIISPLFTPRAVQAYGDYARHLAGSLLDAAIPRGEFDWVIDVAQPLPIRVLISILGVPEEDAPRMIHLSNQMIATDDPDYAPPAESYEGIDARLLPFGSPAALEVFEYGRRIRDDRLAHPRDDLVTRIVNAEVDGERLTDQEYVNFFQLLILAGNETTRTTISQGMLAFIQHPGQLDRLATGDDALWTTAIEEVLRWATPVVYMRRTAMRDHELHGRAIAKGDKVVLWYLSANYDEEAFADPHRFDVGRQTNPQHAAFGGGGIHFCLGAYLARLQMRILFEEVVKRDLRLELTDEPRRIRSNFVNGLKSMPVRVVRGRALG